MNSNRTKILSSKNNSIKSGRKQSSSSNGKKNDENSGDNVIAEIKKSLENKINDLNRKFLKTCNKEVKKCKSLESIEFEGLEALESYKKRVRRERTQEFCVRPERQHQNNQEQNKSLKLSKSQNSVQASMHLEQVLDLFEKCKEQQQEILKKLEEINKKYEKEQNQFSQTLRNMIKDIEAISEQISIKLEEEKQKQVQQNSIDEQVYAFLIGLKKLRKIYLKSQLFSNLESDENNLIKERTVQLVSRDEIERINEINEKGNQLICLIETVNQRMDQKYRQLQIPVAQLKYSLAQTVQNLDESIKSSKTVFAYSFQQQKYRQIQNSIQDRLKRTGIESCKSAVQFNENKEIHREKENTSEQEKYEAQIRIAIPSDNRPFQSTAQKQDIDQPLLKHQSPHLKNLKSDGIKCPNDLLNSPNLNENPKENMKKSIFSDPENQASQDEVSSNQDSCMKGEINNLTANLRMESNSDDQSLNGQTQQQGLQKQIQVLNEHNRKMVRGNIKQKQLRINQKQSILLEGYENYNQSPMLASSTLLQHLPIIMNSQQSIKKDPQIQSHKNHKQTLVKSTLIDEIQIENSKYQIQLQGPQTQKANHPKHRKTQELFYFRQEQKIPNKKFTQMLKQTHSSPDFPNKSDSNLKLLKDSLFGSQPFKNSKNALFIKPLPFSLEKKSQTTFQSNSPLTNFIKSSSLTTLPSFNKLNQLYTSFSSSVNFSTLRDTKRQNLKSKNYGIQNIQKVPLETLNVPHLANNRQTSLNELLSSRNLLKINCLDSLRKQKLKFDKIKTCRFDNH